MARINLVPEALLRSRQRRQRLAFWGLVCGGLVLLVAAPLGFEGINRAQAGDLRVQQSRLSDELSALRAKYDTTATRAVQLHGQIERARALQRKREWSALLTLVGGCLPDDAWLVHIATDPAAPSGRRLSVASGRRPGAVEDKPGKPEAVTIEAPERLTMSGRSLEYQTIYDLISCLQESGIFTDVTLLRSGVERGGFVITFDLVCEW